MPESNELLVRRLVEEVINGRDYSALQDLLHPSYVYRSPGEEFRGAEGLEGLFTAYHSAFSDMNLTIDDLFSTDARVAMSFTITGTHDGEMMGIAPTGKSVSVNGIILSTIEDGRIVEEWEVIDRFTLFQQLGLMDQD